MLWKDAVQAVVEERIKQIELTSGKKQTKIAEDSKFGLRRNFFTRLFNGEIKRLDLDNELEPLASTLGFSSVLELLSLAQEKKTA